MKKNKRKALWGIAFGIGLGTFMILWGALNVWTGNALFVGPESNGWGSNGETRRTIFAFVTRESDPIHFWMIVAFKVSVGALSLVTYLYILCSAYWKRWRGRVEQRALRK